MYFSLSGVPSTAVTAALLPLPQNAIQGFVSRPSVHPPPPIKSGTEQQENKSRAGHETRCWLLKLKLLLGIFTAGAAQ